MWKTVRYKKDGSPLWDVNEQGKVYSYRSKKLIGKKTRDKNPYVAVTSNEDSSIIYVHQLVVKAFPEICGEWFEGCEVHHKDCNGLNNEATNLVVCTKEQHLQFHKELRKLEKIKEQERLLKEQNTLENKIKECKTAVKYSIRAYCRKSKQSKKTGLAPIELSIIVYNKRSTFTLPFKCQPDAFIKKQYPKGFIEYLKNLPVIVKI